MSPDEVRRIRLKSGLTQTAFAHVLGLSKVTIIRYEGDHPLTPHMVKLLRVIDKHPEVLQYFMDEQIKGRHEVELKRFTEDEDCMIVEHMATTKNVMQAFAELATALDRTVESVKFRWYKFLLPELNRQ